MLAVSDSSSLIYLSKIKKIKLLKELFKKIYVPKEVYSETITEGAKKSESDIFLIEELIKEEFIEVKEVKNRLDIKSLHLGELKAISLCQELGIKNLLIDDKDGYSATEILGLNPLRTTSILLILLDKEIISLMDYENSLKELIKNEFFIEDKLYDILIMAGRNKNHKTLMGLLVVLGLPLIISSILAIT
ncbi:MAG: hypothetical protein AABX23_02280 [Nanoarchaeota archaeon]